MSRGSILKLARQTAEQYIKTGQPLALPWPLAYELSQQRACYVSIFEKPGRHFRAMYGQALPYQQSLAEEIIINTITAMSSRHASQFRRADLSYLAFSVAVLGPMERITSHVHLSPHTHGLYIRSDRDKSSIVLPQRTGIETPDEQIATAYREAGINQSQEAISMYRFLVTHYDD